MKIPSPLKSVLSVVDRREFSQRLRSVLAATIAIGGFTGLGSTPAFAAPPIYVNNQLINVPAVVRNNQVFVPVRGVFEKLSAAVNYTPPNNVVARKARADLAQLTLGNRHAKLHGVPRVLGTAPFMSGARIFVPLRFISEAAGATVIYSAAPRAVHISEMHPTVLAVAAAPSPAAATVEQQHGIPWWVWLLLGLIVVGLFLLLLRRRKPEPIITTRSSMSDARIETRP